MDFEAGIPFLKTNSPLHFGHFFTSNPNRSRSNSAKSEYVCLSGTSSGPTPKIVRHIRMFSSLVRLESNPT